MNTLDIIYNSFPSPLLQKRDEEDEIIYRLKNTKKERDEIERLRTADFVNGVDVKFF